MSPPWDVSRNSATGSATGKWESKNSWRNRMVKNLTQLVTRCENDLGWVAPRGVDLWKARQIEVGKLKRAIAKAEQPITLTDLEYALELSRRQKETISSPVALVYRVEKAREVAIEAPTAGVIQQIQDAIDFELDAELPGFEGWVSRLSRCDAQFRAEVLEEWITTRVAEAA